MLPKIYLHWTATGYDWVQDGHYHTIVTGDGKVHRRHDYTIDLYTHTYLRNNNSIGISCSCMGGNPDPWSMPPTDAQIEAMCREIARVVKDWGWKEEDISIQNILTHAEAAANRDGWYPHENYGPLAWGGTGERWDFMQVTKQGKDNGGDILRNKIRSYYRGENKTVLPTPLKFVSEQKIEANGKSLTVAVDEKGASWAAAAEILSVYNLAFQWNSEQRRILIGTPDLAPKYLQDRVQADVGYALCEMSLQGSNARVILTGIIRNGRAFVRVMEFAEEFGITCTFNPLKLGRRLGG